MNINFPFINKPQIKSRHASLQHPVSYRLSFESLLGVPRSAMLDGVISYGGSTGCGFNLMNKAFGEYYERNHFFTSVPIHSKKSLTQVMLEQGNHSLSSTCMMMSVEQQASHHFSMTTVYGLFDDQPMDYFFNAISLHRDKNDLPYLYANDSCGCASYPDKNGAIYHSLMEFLERQSLLGSWISKTYQSRINPELLRVLTPYVNLVDKLLENGELFIFENSNCLPGYSVVIFYFAHHPEDAVQYTVGAKSGLSLIDAIKGAFEEFYQCYTFLYHAQLEDHYLESKAGSGYHLAFKDFNNQKTRSIIPYIQTIPPHEYNTIDEIKQSFVWSYEDVLLALNEISSSIYYYHFYEKALDLHFTKIVSPDFFAHMSLSKPLNIENAYAKKLNITNENAYLESLPFP